MIRNLEEPLYVEWLWGYWGRLGDIRAFCIKMLSESGIRNQLIAVYVLILLIDETDSK